MFISIFLTINPDGDNWLPRVSFDNGRQDFSILLSRPQRAAGIVRRAGRLGAPEVRL
jgi:hypothetical protein